MADDTRVTHPRPGLARAFVLVLALCCALPAAASASQIIVRRDAGLSAGQRSDLREGAGVKLERMLTLPDSELVTVPDADERRALAMLNADPDVQYAAPNVPFQVAAVSFPPSDQLLRYQWDLEQNSSTIGWVPQRDDADIDIAAAWDTDASQGDGVDVAVVDQMIHTTHPDLEGQIDTARAKDVLAHPGCSAAEPIVDHGTHVAGTIAAARNNANNGINSGITGIAPGARVVPVRAFDNCGASTLDEILAAFRYAGEQQIPVVVAAFASDPLNPPDSTVSIAFARLFQEFNRTLFVVAAGNEGMDTSEAPVYPCDTHTLEGSDEVPNLICVGMTDRNDAPDCQSNVGSSVDVYAPGRFLLSTVRTSRGFYGWDNMSGTSMSAAVVAGVAALALSAHPDEPGGLLRLRLLAQANLDYPLGVDAGRINAARALGVELDDDDHGGPGGAWKTCDQDHDGFADANDKCPLAAGSFDGCPDTDGDGVHDGTDNCPTVANDQADLDGDGIGDACDNDVDGDTLAGTDDRCPRIAALTADGCPTRDDDDDGGGGGGGQVITPPVLTPIATPIAGAPAPPPVVPLRFLALSAKVKCTPKKHCKSSATVTVKLSRSAKVTLKVELRNGKKYKRISTRTVTVGTLAKNVTFKGRRGRSLAKGSYRVTVTISGGPQAVRRFRVR
jgi:subtilisin family serine protease